MVLIFNNAATCHAYERVGEGYLLNNMTESPRRRKRFSSHCSCCRAGLRFFFFSPTQNDCSVITLRRLLLSNFTPRDKQIKTYYLGMVECNKTRNRITFTAQKNDFSELAQVSESNESLRLTRG